MGIYRKIVPTQGSGILNKITRHPMVFSRSCHIFNDFPKVPSKKTGPTGTRGANIPYGETVIIGQGHKCGFPKSGMYGNAHLGSINRWVGFKIIQSSASSPSPGF